MSHEDVAPVPGPAAWRTWLEPWFLSYALLGLSVAGVAPILLPIAVGRGGTVTDIGLVIGAFNLGGLSAPLWGGIADRRGLHRLLLISGLLCAGATLAAFPFTSSIIVKLALALGLGVGAASAATIASLFIVENHPRSEWDERIGWLQTFYGAGQVLGLILAGTVSGADLRIGFLISAGAMLFACLPASFMKGKLRTAPFSRPVLKHPIRHAELTAGSPQSCYHHLNAQALEHLLKSAASPLGIFLLAWFLSFGGVAAFFSLYPVLMKNLYGVDPMISSIGFAVAATVGLFVYPPAGRLSNKYGPLRVFRVALTIRIIAFLALLPHGDLNLRLKGVLALIGFSFVVAAWSLLSVTGTEITAQFSEEHEGEGLGLFNACTALAGVLGAVVGGWSAGIWGYEVVPVLGIVGAATGVLITGRFKPPTKTAGE